MSSWAKMSMEISGKISVLGKAHGKAGIWVSFSALTAPALPQELNMAPSPEYINSKE